jgi:hypothetical protein
MSTVLISDPRGFGTQRVPVTGVSRSWVVGGSGSLSAEVLSSDLVTAGLNDELRGHWIVVEDDDAGTWGGVIGDVQPNGDGTTEVAASSFESAFNAIRMPRRNRPLYGMPGTVALEAISASVRGLGNPVQARTADDFGLPVSFPFDGGDLRQALDSHASQTGQEWWIDPDTLAFHWGRKGTDLTGTVQVCEGRHIADWRLPTSLDPVINDLQAYPLNDRHQAMQTITVTNPASITAVGRRQGSAGIPGGSHAVHIRNRAIGTVNELAASGQAIEFGLLNVDSAFAAFREGDTICCLLPSISVQLAVRIVGRTLDDRRVMGCSGIVTERRALG